MLKDLFNVLQNNAIFNFGNIDCIGNIKSKYYEHDFSMCRIINTQKSIENKENWLHFIKNNTIDIIIVACHYSNRYKGAENYLQTIFQNSALDRIIYLKNNNQEKIIDNFINECIEVNDTTNYTISWKNMQFLWKIFINKHQLPNIIYVHQLKGILSHKLNFDTNKDEFTHVISKYLPKISKFLDFFDTNFYNSNELFDVSEIKMLYDLWINDNKNNISEDEVFEILNYFYSNFQIENKKSVLNIGCNKWNKKEDIDNAVRDYMMHNLITNYKDIDAYECYEYYINNSTNSLLVNKNYFIENIN